MFPLLSLITFLPLLGGIVILFLPKERLNLIRWTALSVAWIDLINRPGFDVSLFTG